MRKLFYFVLLVIVGCTLHGDNDPQNVIIAWDPNPPNQGVISYEYYMWTGDDTLTFSIPAMNYEGIAAHLLGVSEIKSDSVLVSLNYMRAGAIAVNVQGAKSSMGLSRFYSYFEFFPPSPPDSVRINE